MASLPCRSWPALLVSLLVTLTPAAVAQEDDGLPRSTGVRPDGSSAAAPDPAPRAPGAPTSEIVAEKLNAPVVFAIGPDGTIYYGEYKTGLVKRADTGEVVFDVGEPAWGNERGFVGFDIDSQGYFYTFHTIEAPNGGRGDNPNDGDASPWVNQLTRWTPDGEKDIVLFEDLPASDWHNAGRLWVDPRDDTVWWAYGDTNVRPSSQDTEDIRGSILHMTRDGDPVPGNIAEDSLIYSVGHRQPYGFAVDPGSGRVMVAENMDLKNDEVNLVEPGGNYGWPACEGPCDPPQDGFIDPVIYYEGTIGPSTAAWLGGDFYFGDFNFGRLHRIFEENGTWFDEIVHVTESGPVLHLVAGPEGNTLYYSSWDRIVRLTFPNVAAAPFVPPESPDGGDGDGSDGNASGDGGGKLPESESRADRPMPALGFVVMLAVAAVVSFFASPPGGERK